MSEYIDVLKSDSPDWYIHYTWVPAETIYNHFMDLYPNYNGGLSGFGRKMKRKMSLNSGRKCIKGNRKMCWLLK